MQHDEQGLHLPIGSAIPPVGKFCGAPGFVICVECERSFDLLNETDADELAHGHDCEV